MLREDWKKVKNSGILIDAIPGSVLPTYQGISDAGGSFQYVMGLYYYDEEYDH